jgi:hypothetical protein
MAKVEMWLSPAIVDGVASGGNSPEGSEYSAESYLQTMNIFSIIRSATGDQYYERDLETYAKAVARYLIYSTLPGTVKSTATTAGTIAAGSSTLSVAAQADFAVGQPIRVALDAAPYVMETSIVALHGNTFTLRDAAIGAATNKPVTHIYRELTWGDATENPSYVYADSVMSDGHVAAAYHALDIVKDGDPETAGYIRFWLDQVATDPAAALWGKFLRFLYDDSTVERRDYTEAPPAGLPTMWGTTNPNTPAMLIGRSSWAADATMVHFLVGGEAYDHTHSHFNSYQIRRGGVWLSNELYGYDVTPFPGVFKSRPGDSKYLGTRYHNTVLMNGHGGNNGRIMATEQTTPARMTRGETSYEHMYARGDASGQYASTRWVAAGYESNNAENFIRDFLYVKPDLVAFADDVSYSAPSVSPTTWIARFPRAPVITGQKITSEYGGQKIVQDIVVPSAAKFTVVNELSENPDLDDYHTQPRFRVETLSGVPTSREWSLQIIQLMNAGGAPAAVKLLTNVNANIAQVGNYVIGAVKGDSPVFPITYTYTGRPRHFLMGFAPNTSYQVSSTGSTITIDSARGVSDQTTTAAGLLIMR